MMFAHECGLSSEQLWGPYSIRCRICHLEYLRTNSRLKSRRHGICFHCENIIGHGKMPIEEIARCARWTQDPVRFTRMMNARNAYYDQQVKARRT